MPKKLLFLFCIIFLGIIFISAPSVLAQSVDQLEVIDGAQLFGSEISEVESIADKLKTHGADVRIRTILTYGSAGNLDQYEAQLEQQSPSWIGQDNDRKNNLIVLIISLQERQTGLYYGAFWADALDNNWLRIQTDIMNPAFRNEDFAGGTIKALEEVQRLITGTGQVQTSSQPETARPMGWIIPVVILVIIGAIIVVFLFRNRSKKRTRQLAARQKAMIPKRAAASGINELIETVQMLEIKVNVMAEKVSPDEAIPVRDSLAKAKRLVDQSSQKYSELSHSAGDPENPRLEESQLAVIEGEYQKIVDNIHQARESIREVEGQIKGIQQALDGFPSKVIEIDTAIRESLKKQDDLKNSGFKTTYPTELMDKGRNTLIQAQELFARKRLNEGMKYISQAAEQVKQAVQAMDDLPSKKLEAEAAIPAISLRIERVKEKINRGSEVFDILSQNYADSNLESIRGNGTEAENRVNWTLDVVGDARDAAGTERQEWHQALELVEKGNTWLTEAELLVKSIFELEANLISEQRNAPNEIDAARVDINKAWDYINRYDEDIRESLEDDLHTAERTNEIAREELRKDKPDYFRVCKLAREANEAADKILIQARNEHEAAERLRVKAASARREAGAKVSIAKMYIDRHHPVVRSEARNYLVNAEGALRQAESTLDTNSQISLALKAESDADRAYSQARNDVENTTMSIPNIPFILFPGTGTSSRSKPSWGTSRPSGSSFRPSGRSGGGGSSSWGSRGGRSSGGGGRKGGGSTGW